MITLLIFIMWCFVIGVAPANEVSWREALVTVAAITAIVWLNT